MKIRLAWILSFVLLGTLLFLGFNRHSRDTFDNYHSVLWSDAAGYHAYLPYWFDSAFMEQTLEQEQELKRKTGHGFELEQNSFFTKYSPGAAILQIPGYLLVFFTDAEAYSPPYHFAVLVTGILFGWLGLLLMFRSLIALRFSIGFAFILTILPFLATNLFYYTVDSPGYSHVYSFFAISLLSFLVLTQDFAKASRQLSIGLVLGLVFLIRPFNLPFVITLTVALLWMKDSKALKEYLSDVKTYLRIVFPILISIGLVLLINYLMNDQVRLDSYQGESFSNWQSPKLLEVLFSTRNGLLLYAPIWGVILTGFIFIRGGYKWLLISVFAAIIYAYGSWWNWELGCAFGYRGLAEFTGIFTLFASIPIRDSQIRFDLPIITTFLMFCVGWSLKLMYSYDECWLEGIWDYSIFFEKLLFGKTR